MNSSNFQENIIETSNLYEQELKIEKLRPKIIQSIKDNLITFISSQTGSGKSTLVPQYLYNYLLDIYKDQPFHIICTEPRVIACTSISDYIKMKNNNIRILTSVDNYYKNEQNLLYLKENDLLDLLEYDPSLHLCDILIIDEVHERTMRLDLLLYYLKHFTLCDKNRRKEFRLVFMSATFNTDDIHNYFSSIDNKKFTFGFINQNELNDDLREDNYDIIYLNSINNSLQYGNAKFNELNMGKVLREISKIVRFEVYSDYNTNVKTILIFLPDYKSIYSLNNMLQKEYKGYINIYQFSSAFRTRQQRDIMNALYYNENNNRTICNVIIATNLAETCLTFPNCDVVIDCGLKKNCRYNYDSNIYEEAIEYISQDSCIQRSGRCGRGWFRGKSYRLFSEESYNLMDRYRKPEIETGNIDLIILRLFKNDQIITYVKKQIEEKGYLDFLSNVEIDKFNKIVDKLIKYNAIEKNPKYKNETTTYFGEWIKITNMDIELGYYFDKFKDKYPEDLNKEVVFQLLNIISTSDNYNNELFYADIDPDWFKLCLVDNNKGQNKKLVDFATTISKNIINKALIKYNNQNNTFNLNKFNNK